MGRLPHAYVAVVCVSASRRRVRRPDFVSPSGTGHEGACALVTPPRARATDDFDLFWQVSKQLLSEATPNVKNVPIRIHVDDGSVVQDNIPAALPGPPARRPTLLLDVLRYTLPSIFTAPAGGRRGLVRPARTATSASATPATTGDDADDASAAGGDDASVADGNDDAGGPAEEEAVVALTPVVASGKGDDDAGDVTTFAPTAGPVDVLVQGLRPRPDTPVVWLCDHLAYLDGFLHIVVRRGANV